MVDDYIARKQGKTEVKYELPQLEPILGDTYGVIAYQEQVMRIAAVLAGFTLGQADMLRKAMGKKDPKVMAKQREAFMDGRARRTASTRRRPTKIFDLMEYFAGYGFNKSHSTTYALLAYQTGYLKANYPWHFMAALLTIEAPNTDKLAMYLGECRDLGVPMLPPDINASELAFTVVDGGRPVRPGRDQERRRRARSCRCSTCARSSAASTRCYTLCEHVDLRLVNKRVLESLVKAGAFDSLLPAPAAHAVARGARLFAAVDGASSTAAAISATATRGRQQLFGGGGDDEAGRRPVPLPDAAAVDRDRSSSRSRRKRSAST